MKTAHRIAAASVAAVTLAIGLSACSGDSQAEPATGHETAPVAEQEPSDENIKPYVDALASEELVEMRKAQRALAAEGSLAEAYMRNQADQSEAGLDGGFPFDPGTVTAHGDGYRACYESDEKGAEPTCYVYDDFKVTTDGKVAAFTIDGRSLKDRLTVGDGSAQRTSIADFTLSTAYITQAGDLAVTGTARSKDAKILYNSESNYRSPSGKIRVMSSMNGPTNLPAHSRATYTFYFDGPINFGGTMTLLPIEDGGAYQDATIKVKIK